MLADWMNEMGLASLKPALAALVLPPAPMIALALGGAWLARTRPRTGRAVSALACAALWLCWCEGSA
ncbi:MAG TPA: YdcF family protein, partial [Burkholderiaceae bacterium]